VSLRKLGMIICTAGMIGVAFASEDAPPEHVKWMKDLGAQMGAIRKGADVDKNAADMQATLKQVGGWWKTRNAPDAMKSCGDTFKGAKAIAEAGGDKEKIAAGMKMVGGGCKGCHDAHRDKISDTLSKIK
jgi:cytochrome c556